MFDKKNKTEMYGILIGYIFGFFLFTTILYYILNLLNKMPENWSYYHIMGITILIVFIGGIIKKFLK